MLSEKSLSANEICKYLKNFEFKVAHIKHYMSNKEGSPMERDQYTKLYLILLFFEYIITFD